MKGEVAVTAVASAQVGELETGLTPLSRLLSQRRPRGATRGDALVTDEPCTGAAGDLGFACRWLGARRVAGAEFFLDLLGFETAVTDCAGTVESSAAAFSLVPGHSRRRTARGALRAGARSPRSMPAHRRRSWTAPARVE